MAPEPFNSLIVIVDIEKFGPRKDVVQASVRDGLYEITKEALSGAGIAAADCHFEDRGDSILLLAPKAGPVVVLGALVREFAQAIGAWNLAHSADYAIRLRMTVNSGFVWKDSNGWVGTAINTAARLIDSPHVREALAGDPGARLALIVGDNLYREVIAMGHPSIDADGYRGVRVNAKELVDMAAWVYVPPSGGSGRAGGDARPEQGPSTEVSRAAAQPGTTTIGVNIEGDAYANQIVGIRNTYGSP